jgi:hypothetical protein
MSAALFASTMNAAESKIILSKDPNQLRTNVQKVIIAGSKNLATATQLMTSNGFHCIINTNGMFDDQIKVGQFFRQTNVNYLHCSTIKKSFGVVQTRFIIALPFDKANVITNVWAQVWEEGLLP